MEPIEPMEARNEKHPRQKRMHAGMLETEVTPVRASTVPTTVLEHVLSLGRRFVTALETIDAGAFMDSLLLLTLEPALTRSDGRTDMFPKS